VMIFSKDFDLFSAI